MATFDEYVDMANASYGNSNDPPMPPGGWDTQVREWATWYGNGFQGAMFYNANEVVVAFSGTKGGLTTAPISQNSANVRIGLNAIPNMCGAAFDMVNWAKSLFPTHRVSICGHSLGGGLAQVVGNWTGCPFISFNGPGMKSHLKMSAFNVFKPQQMVRSLTSKNTDDSIGICLTVKNDFCGGFGWHVGVEVELPNRLGKDTHSMDAIFSGLMARNWRLKTPHDVYDPWPKV
jgi:putative lipase involved disintegration of autophagic bodies